MITIGIDIGATKTVLALIDESGEILHQHKFLSTHLLAQEQTPATALAQTVRSTCAEAGFSLAAIKGIGIGFPGVMDRTTGLIASCPLLPALDHTPLAAAMTDHLGLPTLVENDVNLIALGEHQYGSGRGIDDMAVVFVGSGIGCGLILNGDLYVGADGAAAEFGHTIIEPQGLPCPCGSQGCLELYCSGAALALQAKTLLGNQVAADEPITWQLAERVIQAARNGHPVAHQAVMDLCHYVGVGLVTLANLLNPRLILLGGGIVSGWPESVEIARSVVKTRSRIVVRDRLRVEVASLGERAGLLGAATLVQRV